MGDEETLPGEGSEQAPDAAAPDVSAAGAEGGEETKGDVEIAPPESAEGGQGEAGNEAEGDAPAEAGGEGKDDVGVEAADAGEASAIAGGGEEEAGGGGDDSGDKGEAEMPEIGGKPAPEESEENVEPGEGAEEERKPVEEGADEAKREEGGEEGRQEGAEDQKAAGEDELKPAEGGEEAKTEEAVQQAETAEESAGAADEAPTEETAAPPPPPPPAAEDRGGAAEETQPAAVPPAADEAVDGPASGSAAVALDRGASSFACLPSVVSWSGVVREAHNRAHQGHAAGAADDHAAAPSASDAASAAPVANAAPKAAAVAVRDVSACAVGFAWVSVPGIEGSEEGSGGGLLKSSIAWTEGAADIIGDEIQIEDAEGDASLVTAGDDANNYADESFVSGPDTTHDMTLGDLSFVQRVEETPKKKKENFSRQAVPKRTKERQQQPRYCRVAPDEASLRRAVADVIEGMVDSASGTPTTYKLPGGSLGGGRGGAACAVLRGEMVEMLEQLMLNRARVKADNPPPLQLLVGVCRSRCRDAALRASIEAQNLLDSSDSELVDWFSGAAGAGAYVVGAAVLGTWNGKGGWEDVLARIKATVKQSAKALLADLTHPKGEDGPGGVLRRSLETVREWSGFSSSGEGLMAAEASAAWTQSIAECAERCVAVLEGGGGVMEAMGFASALNPHSSSPLAAWVLNRMLVGGGKGGVPAVRLALSDAEAELSSLVAMWSDQAGGGGDLRKGGSELLLSMSPFELLVSARPKTASPDKSHSVRRRDRSTNEGTETSLQWVTRTREMRRRAGPGPPLAAISLKNASKGRYADIFQLIDAAGIRREGYSKMSSVLHRLSALRLRSVAPSELKPLVRSVSDADGIVDLTKLPLALAWHDIEPSHLARPNPPQVEEIHLAPVIFHTTGPQERLPSSGISLIDQFAPLVYDTRSLNKRVVRLTSQIESHKSHIVANQDQAASKIGLGGPRASPEYYSHSPAEKALLSSGWDISPDNSPRRVMKPLRPPSSLEKQKRKAKEYMRKAMEEKEQFRATVQQFARGEKEPVFFGAVQYNREHVAAVVKIQKVVKGVIQRQKIRSAFRQLILSAMSLDEYAKKKTSEINHMFRNIAGCDIVSDMLTLEAKNVSAVLDVMQANEEKDCAEADAEADIQLKELEEAEAEAEKQVSEAREAEVKMEKERDEMLAWRAKAQRYLENFQASCRKRGVSEDIEHDQLKMDHPDLWREKNQLSGIQMRADKEKAQYDDSMANLNQERAEATYALEEAARERSEWQEAWDESMRERKQVEAFAMARKFTDPQVSVKERLRARSKTSTEAPRVVRKMVSDGGKKDFYLGAIRAADGSSYAGDFIVVQDEEDEALMSAFEKAVPPDAEEEALDLPALQEAMYNIGRRLNLNEAERLVKSFDTDGGGTVDFEEFKAGFKRMVGMELPHGLGVERLYHGSRYEGEHYEDKRSGVGMMTTPSGHFFLGHWDMGDRHGRGIEGEIRTQKDGKNAIIPVAVVQCVNGRRTSVERFDMKSANHRKLFRSMCLVVDAAKKREQKARSIIAPGLKMTTLPKRPRVTVVAVPPPLHLSGPNVKPQGRRHSLMTGPNMLSTSDPLSASSTLESSASPKFKSNDLAAQVFDVAASESADESNSMLASWGMQRIVSSGDQSQDESVGLASRPGTGRSTEGSSSLKGSFKRSSMDGAGEALAIEDPETWGKWSLQAEQAHNLELLQKQWPKDVSSTSSRNLLVMAFKDVPEALEIASAPDDDDDSPRSAQKLYDVRAWREKLPPIVEARRSS